MGESSERNARLLVRNITCLLFCRLTQYGMSTGYEVVISLQPITDLDILTCYTFPVGKEILRRGTRNYEKINIFFKYYRYHQSQIKLC